jgi:hypothetical protein
MYQQTLQQRDYPGFLGMQHQSILSHPDDRAFVQRMFVGVKHVEIQPWKCTDCDCRGYVLTCSTCLAKMGEAWRFEGGD